MGTRLDFGCLPTAVGSMPQTDPVAACRQVLKYLPEVPAWPQLPSRSYKEGQYMQSAEGFPGLRLSDHALSVDRSGGFDAGLEKLYQAYLSQQFQCCPTSAEHAAGLHALLSWEGLTPVAVKGQMTGPVTWTLGVTQPDGRPVLYDETLADAAAKFLHLKAAWQENALRAISPRTIVFVDEPSLSYLGSAFVSISRPQVLSLLNEVFHGLSGIKGVHCCANTDWSALLESDADIVSFDTYGFWQSLSLYPEQVAAFLKRGGAVAWGIVPNTADALSKETAGSLRDRLDEAMAPLTRKGISHRQMLDQALLTPSCGLAGLDAETAGRALELLATLSRNIRKRYTL